ncbi:MAG: CotH kinase family protein [Flavobacteriales bacterium]|nr:CotH kinase family protein [Flavobacteriales bacterium]
MRTWIPLLPLLAPVIVGAQTFTGAGGAIPDDGSTAYFSVSVSGLNPATVDTSTFGVMSVCLSLLHPYVADMELSLVAPDGTTVPLSIANGGSGNNYIATCFEQDAATSILTATPPFSGSFRPQGQLGLVNNGQNGNAVWSLKVNDNYPFADAGTLLAWSITFGNDPAGYFSFTESDLPIVVINTNGEAIVDEPKVMADIGIIWNGPGVRNRLTDPFNHFEGKVGIELRGASSATMPKKSYGLETWDALGNTIDTALLGMPSENDWVLSAGYPDKSLMRNAFVYATARDMGRYAPRTMHVDLVLNGTYAGVYTFTEKIKRDPERVDIAKLLPTDVSGDELTGGYIIKVDKTTGSGGDGWYSQLPPAYAPNGPDVYIQYDDPDEDELVAQQAQYIEAYVDSFESALTSAFPDDPITGFPHFIEPVSFADLVLINELMRNVDGYRISTFYHKDKNSNGGRLVAGPVWDFDIAGGNGDYCDAWKTTGWAYRFGQVCGTAPQQVSGWWQLLMAEPAFQRVVRCRWEELKMGALSIAAIDARIDSMAAMLNESQGFNFKVWPLLGVYTWPNYYIAQDHAGEVDTLKWFLHERWNWIDAQLPTATLPCNMVGLPEELAAAHAMQARFVGDQLHVLHAHDLQGMLTVLDASGRTMAIAQSRQASGSTVIDLAGAPPGVYVVHASGTGVSTRAVRTE